MKPIEAVKIDNNPVYQVNNKLKDDENNKDKIYAEKFKIDTKDTLQLSNKYLEKKEENISFSQRSKQLANLFGLPSNTKDSDTIVSEFSDLPKYNFPHEDTGFDKDTDDYYFSSFPKYSKEMKKENFKGRTEIFKDHFGITHGAVRILYGNTNGDQKFNFDGVAIGAEIEFKEDGLLVNKDPEIIIPIDKQDYIFNQANICRNNTKVSGILSFEGLKVKISYDKGNITLGDIDFKNGAITGNLADWTIKYPYIMAPIYITVVGAGVYGAYELNKGKGAKEFGLGNWTVYKKDEKLKIQLSPEIRLTGKEKFIDSINPSGGKATLLYKYDEDTTLRFNIGYNKTDSFNTFIGITHRF